MNNEIIQENQVAVVHESEQNPWYACLKGVKSKERNFSAKERQ